jgi:peptidoglycan/xylan/chitin deacetylase (PgdA/CDA1 family)
LKEFLYRLYARSGADRLAWALGRRRLRILAYHGVCDDHLREERWVPSYLVTRSAFDAQLAYLGRHARVLPLTDAIRRLAHDGLPDRAVCLTFDDGYANNLHLAYPLLVKHGLPASFFIGSAYIDSGQLFPFDRLRLIRCHGMTGRCDGRLPLLDYVTNPLDVVVEHLDEFWGEVEAGLSQDQRETLRPLRADELRVFDPGLVEFGAHTHMHCILRNETRGRREVEIRQSIRRLRELTGRPLELFSYPNGLRGDFDEHDKAVLRSERIIGAVTMVCGSNGKGADPLELARYPVGLFHTESAFAAEVTGMGGVARSVFVRVVRGRGTRY